MIGPNHRAWIDAEVDAWIKSRPTTGPAPKGIAAKRRQGNPRKSADSATEATA